MNFENALQRLIEFSEKKDSVDFDVFFNDTKDLVYRVAFHYMRCDSEAEDILQSVFLKIFTYAQEKPKSISEIKNLKGWLIQIAVNSSKMSIRTKIRQREKNMKKISETNSFSNEKQELYLQVTKYLSELPEKYRLPVCLHYVENMSFAEISTALNIDQPTLKVQASRGIAKLRDILQKAGVAISSSALSSVLIESSFQKAPANISFHKTTLPSSAKLEQVLRYNEKTTPINYPILAIFAVSIIGLIVFYFSIKSPTIEPIKIANVTEKIIKYNFEESMPKDVNLPINSQLSIEKGKGLVFPDTKEDLPLTFPKISISDQPFAVTSEIYNTYPALTMIQSIFGDGLKKIVWHRPASFRGNDWNHYKIVFCNPYEIIYIKDIPVTIFEVAINQSLTKEKLKITYNNAILKNVTIQPLDSTAIKELKEYIALKVNAKQAVNVEVNLKDLVVYKQNGIYLIPSIQNLKKPIEILIKLKENVSAFDGIQVYFLDGKDSLTVKTYGNMPDTYGVGKIFLLYLFDEICFIAKENETSGLVFETKSKALNKNIGFEFDLKLVESIQIVPVKDDNDIFLKSQKLLRFLLGK